MLLLNKSDILYLNIVCEIQYIKDVNPLLPKLKHSEQLLKLITDQFYLIVVCSDGTLVDINETFLKMTGYEREQLLNNHCHEIQFDHFTKWKKPLDEPESTLIQGKKKTGEIFYMYAIRIVLRNELTGDFKVLWLGSDITKEQLLFEKNKRENHYLKQVEEALHLSSIISVVDQDGNITYVNDHFCEISGYSQHTLLHQKQYFLDSNFHPPSFFEDMWDTVKSGQQWTGEICNQDANGTIFWVHTTVIPFLNINDTPSEFLFIQTDITEQKNSSRNDFQRTVRHLQNIIFKYEVKNRVNLQFTMLEGQLLKELDLSLTDLNHLHFMKIYSEKERFTILRNLLRASFGHQVQFELTYLNYTILIYLSPIIVDGIVTEVVGTGIDITERKQAEETIAYMAYYDSLTSLPNRQLLEKLVNERINQYRPSLNNGFAIMFIDLDRFKSVNDSMGHLIGDQLLIAVGERLKKCVRQNDIVARLSGDEYVLVISTTNEENICAIGDRIVQEISSNFTIDNYDIFVTPSIGISIFPEDGKEYEALLRNADSAMYLAKKSGKNNYQFFTEQLRDEMIEKTLLEMDLRRSLKIEQFTLLFQPLFSSETNEMMAVEAIPIWNHPKRGSILPDAFIPIAEDAGLILPFSMWFLRKAAIQLKQWQEIGHNTIQMHLKISTRLFEQPFFAKNAIALIEDIQLEASSLNLEIHGDISINSDELHTTIQQLRDAQFNITIGGFGSSHVSFGAVSSLPISYLKLDSSFIKKLTPTHKFAIQTINQLTQNLEIPMIIDHIQTEEQANFVKTLKNSIVQGNYFASFLLQDQFEMQFLFPNFL